MRISDWSSDVCSSDLRRAGHRQQGGAPGGAEAEQRLDARTLLARALGQALQAERDAGHGVAEDHAEQRQGVARVVPGVRAHLRGQCKRSEEHTSELQSLMHISYAVFCLKKKKKNS